MIVLIISFICLFSFNTQAEEELYLIRVKGEITNLTTEKKLKPGDQIKLSDELSFKGESDAILYSNTRGRLQLKKLKNKAKPSGELYYIVKENLLAVKKSAISRSNQIVVANNQRDFKSFFGKYYSVSSLDYLQVDTYKYPLDKNNFFYFRYTWKEEEINKMIDFNGDTLLLKGEEIFSLNGTSLKLTGSIEASLYYYQALKETSTFIVSSNFELINSDIILNEIALLVEILKKDKIDNVELRTEVEKFLSDEYGNYCFRCFWDKLAEQ